MTRDPTKRTRLALRGVPTGSSVTGVAISRCCARVARPRTCARLAVAVSTALGGVRRARLIALPGGVKGASSRDGQRSPYAGDSFARFHFRTIFRDDSLLAETICGGSRTSGLVSEAASVRPPLAKRKGTSRAKRAEVERGGRPMGEHGRRHCGESRPIAAICPADRWPAIRGDSRRLAAVASGRGGYRLVGFTTRCTNC